MDLEHLGYSINVGCDPGELFKELQDQTTKWVRPLLRMLSGKAVAGTGGGELS